MKRPAQESEGQREPSKRTKISSTHGLNFQSLLDAIDDLNLTVDQLLILSQKVDSVYSKRVNCLTQNFPLELWNKIAKTAQFHKLPIQQLLQFRTISKAWEKIISSFTKVNTLDDQVLDLTKVFQMFRLRSLKLDPVSILPTDFGLWTSLTKLKIVDSDPSMFSLDMKELAPLTNLTNLTISSHHITSLGPLTSLETLFLKHPFDLRVAKLDSKDHPRLTRLISDCNTIKNPLCHVTIRDVEESYQYDGEWRGESYHGQGTRHSSTTIYRGQWDNSKMEGYGVCYYLDYEHPKPWKIDFDGPEVKCLDRYEGQWKDNRRSGQGTYDFSENGNKYVGQWVNGNKHGHGIMYFALGHRYEGEFNNDLRTGKGICYYPKGSRYEGQLKNGKKHGPGVMYYVNGRKYEGEWKRGWKKKGAVYYPNGDRFEGEFNQERQRKGIWYYADGTTEEKDWYNPIK